MTATLDRRTIFLAQTPQAFRRQVLARRAADRDVTRPTRPRWPKRAGHPVRIVVGEASNIKITTPEDLRIAETIARAKAAAERPRPRGLRLRPASSGRGPAADSRRRHDSVRERARRPFRRRCGLPRRDRRDSRRRRRAATSAGIFPTPIRRGRARRASSCCAGPSRSCARRGFEVGNVDVDGDRSSGRSSRRTSTRCARTLAEALGIDRRSRQHQRQDQRGRRRDRPRRGDRRRMRDRAVCQPET